MNHIIENDFLTVEVAAKGAEVQSIKSKKTGVEYLWQGNAEYWGNRATVLFPICGRLVEGKYTWKDKEYEMGTHGIARFQTFRVYEQKEEAITFELRANEETKAVYPFDFVLRMTYSLEGTTLRTAFYVENETEEVLPFAFGGHPGYNVPFGEGENFEDYYLEFACEKKATKLRMGDNGFFYTGINDPFPMENGKIIRLSHEFFNNPGVFLAGMCQRVSLKSTKHERSLTMYYEGMTHLGLWHKPASDAPYVCIEPWHGVPSYDGKVDDFATKNEMIRLAKGENHSAFFEVAVNE